MNYYQKNLKYLSAVLQDKLSQVKLRYSLEKSKNGLPIINLTDKQGRIVPLHSKYDPQKEAERFISQFNLLEKNTIFILGFALGYHIKEILKQEQIHSLIIIEPDIEVFKLALISQDFSDLFSFSNLELIIAEKNTSLLFNNLSRFISLDNLKKIQIIGHNPSIALYPNYYEEATNTIKKIVNMNISNLSAFISYGKIWQENILQNFFEIINNPPVDSLFNKFQNLPAIIVSAGPSLNKNIKYLNKVTGKALLISVDTALKPLLQENIKPDIVVSVDAQEANLRHFQNISTQDLTLVADASVCHQIFKSFNSIKFITCDEHSIMSWLYNYISFPLLGYNKISILRGGGSVATVAFDLAKKIGADPIIFVGQDFCFYSEGVYAQGTSYQEDWINNLNKFNTLEMQQRDFILSRDLIPYKDIYGNTVYTNNNLASYCEWLKQEIAQSRVTCINATEGGILTEGVIITSLKEALEKYTNKEINIRERLNEAKNCLPLFNKKEMISDIKLLTKEGSLLEDLCLRGLQVLEEGIKEDKLRELNSQIDNLKTTSLLQDTIKATSWLLHSKENFQKECLENYYKNIKEANQNLVGHLKKILDNLVQI
ncbi:MAG: DUF115 domain-containing protein [bacterium]|nr:DUF115 domain-containing protein [bacterium]